MIRDTSGQDRVLAPPPASPRRRQLMIGGGIAAAVLLALTVPTLGRWLGSGQSVSGERLRTAEVRRGTLVRDVAVQGRMVAAVSPTLYAPAAGTVKLKVQAGDVIKQGQALAEIDSPELRSKLVQEQSTLASLQAEASRAALDAQLARSTAQKLLDQAEIDRTAALRDLERSQRGFDGGAVSSIEVARAQDSLKKADIGLSHAQRDYGLQDRGAGLDTRNKHLLAQRQQALVAELQRQVDELNIRSPVDGVVGTVSITDRTVVPLNQPLLVVVDLRELEVELPVPESYADDLRLGMGAEISYGGQTYAGKLRSVSPEVVNGQVMARVRFADAQPDGKRPTGLRQNQRVSTRVLIEEKPNVLMVQRGPFLDTGGGRIAYVMDGDTAVKRAITTGASSLSDVEVLSGLQTGDRVVISDTTAFNGADQVLVND
ncbi:efflux RND transporter periplasmic adaptor subunit [Lysobacter panacisoli]|uniref:Efflux RND transporter periplasmic adaptor subunit n=1 Tax=Lysobacter panacisoli TaxID=1255263 RepID=A0ABP9LP77_9GAMM|nr:HlyD family efflux transporter periplasmic adaptor subunit [Lysobacter panacisoli]